ncbi:hypothetical protein G6M02_19730 [Agrobacterium rhizogenes]|nr:hypothetical protein [Rhizobium rhizogenes]
MPSEEQQLEDYRFITNQAIIRFISTIENGPSFSYDAVTGNFDGEGLSIGLIQFNFGGDAQITFGNIDRRVFLRHMPRWGEQFYRAVHTQSSKRAIALVVQMQSQSGKTWRVQPDALAELRAFLSSPESKSAQDKRVAYEFAKASSRAKQWAEARGESTPSNREIANFFDNQVFSGGALNGIWLDQAKAFRAKFSSDAEMASFVASWLKSCPVKGPKALYGAAEGAANGEIWSRKLAAGTKLSESQSLLFSLGFLRGLAAVGPADDPSQAGVFKSQVVSRRGLIATSWGTANGVPWPGGPLDR